MAAGHGDGSSRVKKAKSASLSESMAQCSITLTAISSIPNPGSAQQGSPSVSSFTDFYSQLLMEKPTIPYAGAFMHFSLTIIRYPRTAFDFC